MKDNSSFSNNGHLGNGVLSESPTWISDGAVGGAYEFDGEDDYIHIPDDNSLDISEEITISAWVKPRSFFDNEYEAIVWKQNYFDTNQATTYSLTMYWNSGQPTFMATTSDLMGSTAEGATTELNLNEWQHIVVTYNSNKNLTTYYYNGAYDGNSTAITGTINSSGAPIYIGRRMTNMIFNGSIDEVIILNTTLSAEQIYKIYESGVANHSVDTINNKETQIGENWSVCVTASDGFNDSATICSENLTIVENNIPTVDSIFINSSLLTNLSSENISVTFTNSDANGESLSNVTDWRINGSSLLTLNMPFNTKVSTIDADAVKDYSTKGFNGQLGGGNINEAPTWTPNGKVGGAYEFDGINDHIDMNGISYMPKNPNATYGGWFYFNQNATDKGVIQALFVDISNPQIILYQHNANDYLYAGGDNDYFEVPFTDKTWHHIVVTFAGDSTTAKLYLDGIKYDINLQGDGGINLSAYDSLQIGGKTLVSSQYFFNGTMDEIFVTNKTLSEEQIITIYQAGLNNHSVNTIVSNETQTGENWSACITASDGFNDSATICSENLTIVSSNTLPKITYVDSLPAQNPLEGNSKEINFSFTVDDADGNNTINVSSASTIFELNGLSRSNASCASSELNVTALNITCTINMKYYDESGVWNINVSISDNNGVYVENTTQTMTYNELSSISLSTSLLDFGALDIGAENQTTTPITINNTGNVNFTFISLKAYDIVNDTNIISAGNFSVNISDSSGGDIVTNNSYINITGASLDRSTDAVKLTELIYIYANIPNITLPAGLYSSIQEWVIMADTS